MHALVVFLRVDDQTPILSLQTRARIVSYLRDVTARLVRTQHADGFWGGTWPTARPESSQPQDREGERLSDRILVTGHAMEWWSLAPEELHPPRPVLAGAGQWLVRTIDELSDDQVDQYFTYLSNACRALALWRSRNPAEFSSVP